MNDQELTPNDGIERVERRTDQQSAIVVPEECHSCACPGPTEAADGDIGASVGEPYPYVYALGQISFRFPDVGVEREFSQSIGRAGAAHMTDRQALREALTRPENRYLVHQLCFVFNVQGMETYILQPSDAHTYGLLAEEAVRPDPKPTDLDVVIGRRGPLSSPEACNGLTLPTVRLAQLYSFDRDALVHSIQRPDDVPEEGFEEAAHELLDRVLRMTDNTGATPKQRTTNYLAVRYPVIYQKTFQEFADNASLTSIEVQHSDISENRTVMDAIFSYMDRTTFVTTKYGVRTDVHNMFPFVVAPLSHRYE